MEVDELLPISALEHLAYCERQCALIHVDGVWIDNEHTVLGHQAHERVDHEEVETRPGVRVVRRMALRCERLGLWGFADVVEFHRRPGGERAYPVEYKKGARKSWLHDDVQLAAQAMALEEMLGQSIAEGAIFYGKTRRRRVVKIDAALRASTEAAVTRLRSMIARREVPPPRLDRRCEECSLRLACCPEASHGPGALERALRGRPE
jgi:CRISPR-associated exonuclease Cas4